MNELDKIDITSRATAAGWTLPDGWQVLAYARHDEDITDPRDEGDVYKTDVDEADYDNTTKAFCQRCDAWIRRIPIDDMPTLPTIRTAEAHQKHLDTIRDDFSTDGTTVWVRAEDKLHTCPSADAAHQPAEPLAVRMWRRDEWEFVTVAAEVIDGQGREWGYDSLSGTESGRFPRKIDADTGQVENIEIDPLSEASDYPLPDIMANALAEAAAALELFAANAPIITGPSR